MAENGWTAESEAPEAAAAAAPETAAPTAAVAEADSAPTPADNLHRNLIVFFIPRDWDDAALKAYFESYGTVETCKVMMDRETAASRGFGFVKFVNRKDAENCVWTANGAEAPGGKRLKVQKADLGRGPPGHHSVFVAGFEPTATTEQELRTLFGPYGNIIKLNVLPLKEGKTKGTAFVTYEHFAEANLAAESLAQSCYLGEQWLTVKLAQQSVIAAQALQWGKGKGKGDFGKGKGDWGANLYAPYPSPGKGNCGKGDFGGWGAMGGGAWGGAAPAAGGWGGWGGGAPAWGAPAPAMGSGYGYGAPMGGFAAPAPSGY